MCLINRHIKGHEILWLMRIENNIFSLHKISIFNNFNYVNDVSENREAFTKFIVFQVYYLQ